MSWESPIISAIVSTYNSEQFLRGRLDDLLNQSIGNKAEIIIVNSGSQQNEDVIIQEYISRYQHIKSIKTPFRESIYQAWNRGIKLATGKYITNANTDDRLHPKALEILSSILDSNPHIGLVYADQKISTEPSVAYNDKKSSRTMRRPQYSRLRLLAGYIVGPQAVWRSSLHFKDQIWFDESYEVAGDYDFVCRVAEKYPILHTSQILGSYYLARDKSNKEYQDIDKTATETAKIQIRYGKRYIDVLNADQRKKLKSKLLFYLRIPSIIHIVIFRLSQNLSPRHYILPRAFVNWMSALILMKEGDIETSIKLCKSCINYPRAVTARLLLQELLKFEE
ncbi:MAG: glycosyltransferase [Bacteroidota bacterium]|nr:glycosyltransferase [Bacteroidota bacterium]